jgi:hypothetical protein
VAVGSIGQPSASQALFEYPIKEAGAAMFLIAGSALVAREERNRHGTT